MPPVDVNLDTSDQAIVDMVADALFLNGRRFVSGTVLRQGLSGTARTARERQINKLVPTFLTRQGRGSEDSYSLSPLGVLRSKHAATARSLGIKLRDLVVGRFSVDPDFRDFGWDQVKQSVSVSERELSDKDLEAVSFVLMCLGAWGGGGSSGPHGRIYTWSRPAARQLEDLLAPELGVDETFHRVHRELLRQHELAKLLDGSQSSIPNALLQEVFAAQHNIAEGLDVLDSEHVTEAWTTALQRLQQDPAGAITLARTLVETVVKHILDDLGQQYPSDGDLPKLYKLVSEKLILHPSQHSLEAIKQILSGCISVVNGLAALRNKDGDAHGKGRTSVRPAPRHAELAVTLAGGVSQFLIATWQDRSTQPPGGAKK